MWMNEYDIEESLRSTARNETPNLRKGAEILSNLKDWTNNHSDGWPHWQKPSRSATKLMDLLHAARYSNGYGYEDHDITEADLKKALSPIKAFLTRQGVDHAEVFKEEKPASALPFIISITFDYDNSQEKLSPEDLKDRIENIANSAAHVVYEDWENVHNVAGYYKEDKV